jgi:hypothetical protein
MWSQTTSQGAQGSASRANPMAGRPHFESVQAETRRLRSHIGSQEYPMPESRSKPGGVAGCHVDGCPTVHHLQTDSIKSVEALLYIYIGILMVEFTHTTLFL